MSPTWISPPRKARLRFCARALRLISRSASRISVRRWNISVTCTPPSGGRPYVCLHPMNLCIHTHTHTHTSPCLLPEKKKKRNCKNHARAISSPFAARPMPHHRIIKPHSARISSVNTQPYFPKRASAREMERATTPVLGYIHIDLCAHPRASMHNYMYTSRCNGENQIYIHIIIWNLVFTFPTTCPPCSTTIPNRPHTSPPSYSPRTPPVVLLLHLLYRIPSHFRSSCRRHPVFLNACVCVHGNVVQRTESHNSCHVCTACKSRVPLLSAPLPSLHDETLCARASREKLQPCRISMPSNSSLCFCYPPISISAISRCTSLWSTCEWAPRTRTVTALENGVMWKCSPLRALPLPKGCNCYCVFETIERACFTANHLSVVCNTFLWAAITQPFASMTRLPLCLSWPCGSEDMLDSFMDITFGLPTVYEKSHCSEAHLMSWHLNSSGFFPNPCVSWDSKRNGRLVSFYFGFYACLLNEEMFAAFAIGR